MNENYVRRRITQLRIIKGVSEYKMSMDLGHSKSYIQSISSGRALPSLSELLFMCEYFDVTVAEFFSDDIENPILVSKIMSYLKGMEDEDLLAILAVVKRMANRK